MLITCLGPTFSGKTTLLKRLTTLEDANSDEEDNYDSILTLPKTLPTVGVNQYSVPLLRIKYKEIRFEALKQFCFGPDEEKVKEKFVTVRELGGAIQPLWHSYLGTLGNSKESQHFIFVIDSTDFGRVSDAGVHLVEAVGLIEEAKQESNFLIVLSKIDLLKEDQKERIILNLLSLLRVAYLTAWCKFAKLTVIEYSAETGQGFDQVLNWLRAFY